MTVDAFTCLTFAAAILLLLVATDNTTPTSLSTAVTSTTYNTYIKNRIIMIFMIIKAAIARTRIK